MNAESLQIMPDDSEPNQTTQSTDTDAGWQFHAEGQATPNNSQPNPKPVKAVQWTASEFIAHHKTSSWYLLLGGGAIALAAVVFLVTQDKISTAMVAVVAIIFGIFASRKPRELPYSVDNESLHIGDKSYPYATFRSFSVVQEEGVDSIRFMPLKRFMPILSIYFEPQDEQKIIDVLSQYLPVEERQLDAVDKLMHKIRF